MRRGFKWWLYLGFTEVSLHDHAGFASACQACRVIAGWDIGLRLQELLGENILQGINDGMARVRNTEDEGKNPIPIPACMCGRF